MLGEPKICLGILCFGDAILRETAPPRSWGGYFIFYVFLFWPRASAHIEQVEKMFKYMLKSSTSYKTLRKVEKSRPKEHPY